MSFPMNVGSNRTPLRGRSVRFPAQGIRRVLGSQGLRLPTACAYSGNFFLEVVPHHAPYPLVVRGVFRLVRWYPLKRGRDVSEMTEIVYY
jgi:hypothetical protein